ncbi:MAG: hypothetical protein RL014_1017 [Pseudomonadota bacterium]|jgi:vacuolar-type H+-ATPase subunit F/Vma7
MMLKPKNKRELIELLTRLGDFQIVLVSEGRAQDLSTELRKRGNEQVVAIVIKG